LSKNRGYDLFDAFDIDWWGLSHNPSPFAIDLLSKNLDKIDWVGLCQNENPNAIKLLENNFDKVSWWGLSENPNAIDWYQLSRTSVILEELMEKTWHPSRFRRWCLEHDDEFFLGM
jgi:hypothetical protein